MPFVIDTSVAATWLLPDEGHLLAEAALDRLKQEKALVPTLFHYEIANVFHSNEQRGRIDENATASALKILQTLQIESVHSLNHSAWIKLAHKHNLTVYDASFLHLALERQIPLYTLDKKLLLALAHYPSLIPAPLAPSPRRV